MRYGERAALGCEARAGRARATLSERRSASKSSVYMPLRGDSASEQLGRSAARKR